MLMRDKVYQSIVMYATLWAKCWEKSEFVWSLKIAWNSEMVLLECEKHRCTFATLCAIKLFHVMCMHLFNFICFLCHFCVAEFLIQQQNQVNELDFHRSCYLLVWGECIFSHKFGYQCMVVGDFYFPDMRWVRVYAGLLARSFNHLFLKHHTLKSWCAR